MKHILSKTFVASHELIISLEIRTSSNINYILESLSEGGGGGGGGAIISASFTALELRFHFLMICWKIFIFKFWGHAPRLPKRAYRGSKIFLATPLSKSSC